MHQLLKIALIFALAACPASASLVATFNATFPANGVAVGPLDQFDPTLGTLASIDFIFTSSTSASVSIVDGPGNPDQLVDVNFGAAIELLNGTTTLVMTTPISTLPGVLVLGDGSTENLTINSTNIVTMASLTDPALFAPFVGVGSINLLLNADGQVATSPGLDVPFSVSGSGQVSGTVQVVYNVVPEPVGLVLMGAGLIGVGLAKKSRFVGKKDSAEKIVGRFGLW